MKIENEKYLNKSKAKTSHEQRKYCNSVISILKEEICISEAEIRHGRKRVRMCTAHCPFAERQANFVDKDYNHFKCTLKISYCSRETVVVFSFSSVFFFRIFIFSCHFLLFEWIPWESFSFAFSAKKKQIL